MHRALFNANSEVVNVDIWATRDGDREEKGSMHFGAGHNKNINQTHQEFSIVFSPNTRIWERAF